MKIKVFLLLFFTITFQSFSQDLILPSMFSDNMVLQQKTKINIWGWASVSEEIMIKASWGKASSVKTDSSGKWIAVLETPSAGGPYQLTIKGKKTEINIKNILIGEVWICSGQSNMEMTFTGWPPRDTVYKAKEEIAKAGNSKIRMFTVAKIFSLKEEEKCKGSWQETNSITIKNFSATAYYFGVELYKSLNVPIGLINVSYEGTQIKSWMSAEALSIYPEFGALKENLKMRMGEESSKQVWLDKHKKIEINPDDPQTWKNLDFHDSVCASVNFSDLDWARMKLPAQWENTLLGNFDGVIWFRRQIDLPLSMRGKELILDLPPIDDMDQTWVNGIKIGSTETTGAWTVPRRYIISKELTKSNKLLIAIRVVDYQGGGGIIDSQRPFRVVVKSDTLDKEELAGNWRYQVVAEFKKNSFYLMDIENREYQCRAGSNRLGANTPTVLFNGMIRPLVPYTAKGFLWYQGESNIGGEDRYSSYLSTMVKEWRAQWRNNEMPFYFVQIAPFKYSGGMNSESAVFRNTQRIALDSINKSGMVVTLDIGDPYCIHPSKKREVGERLAQWALAKDYHKDIVCSGPLYKSFSISENKIRIEFEYIGTGLISKSGILKGFEIAGKDLNFSDAIAVIENNTVVVYSDKVIAPVKVRYAWRNCSEASLYNTEGLPASTFVTE